MAAHTQRSIYSTWLSRGQNRYGADAYHRRHLANTIESSVWGCDAALCRITLTTSCFVCYRLHLQCRTLLTNWDCGLGLGLGLLSLMSCSAFSSIPCVIVHWLQCKQSSKYSSNCWIMCTSHDRLNCSVAVDKVMASVWVMLHTRVKFHSPTTPQSTCTDRSTQLLACHATTAPSQPRPLPTVARVATRSHPQLTRPLPWHRQTLPIFIYRFRVQE